MQRSYLISIGLTILLGVSLLVWASQKENQSFPSTALLEQLEQGQTEIDLHALTEEMDFRWTAVDVFGPYTTSKWIEDSMGAEFELFKRTGEVLENQFLLVFANEEKIITTVNLSREFGDYEIKENRYLVVQ